MKFNHIETAHIVKVLTHFYTYRSKYILHIGILKISALVKEGTYEKVCPLYIKHTY